MLKNFFINFIALSAMFALVIEFEMCLAHVSFESKQTPRTFIFGADLTFIPFRMISKEGVSLL